MSQMAKHPMLDGYSYGNKSKRFHSIHSRDIKDKRARAIKLIQKRWKKTTPDSSRETRQKCRRTLNTNDVGRAIISGDQDDNTDEDASNQNQNPTLLFRRTNLDYSSTQQYSQLHFLNASTILATDSDGQFDIVGVQSAKNNGSEGEKGSGRLLADRIKLSTDKVINTKDSPLEVYGFCNGSRFAVGMPSGDVEIISTERASAGGLHYQSCSSMEALWSCLPTVATQYIGPRRRFGRNEKYTLRYMLSLKDQEKLLQEANDHSTFTELDSWDDEAFCIDRSHHSSSIGRINAASAQWAFREGGIGTSSALIGACVDRQMDCFSVRIMDSREKQTESRPKIFVDTSSPPPSSIRDNLASTCFSGEYGLVTAHNFVDNCSPEKCYSRRVLKWYDLRMLWKRPVKSMNLSFPRDVIFGTSAIEQMEIEDEESRSFRLKSARLGSVDLDGNPHGRCSPQIKVLSRLTGPNDSSDRIVVTLEDFGEYEYLIIQPSRQEVVQRMSTLQFPMDRNKISTFVPYCFSRYLDCMALWADRTLPGAEGSDFVSIYDISQHQTIMKDGSKKRHVPTLCSNSDGYLGRFEPRFLDSYGLESDVNCFCMDDLGSTIAFGTNDGDIYML